jgi:hypothetical protein
LTHHTGHLIDGLMSTLLMRCVLRRVESRPS